MLTSKELTELIALISQIRDLHERLVPTCEWRRAYERAWLKLHALVMREATREAIRHLPPALAEYATEELNSLWATRDARKQAARTRNAAKVAKAEAAIDKAIDTVTERKTEAQTIYAVWKILSRRPEEFGLSADAEPPCDRKIRQRIRKKTAQN